MVALNFNTLKIEGFAGIQPLTIVKLDDPGLNVITGANGTTKTTRFSALVWCLYGTPLKPKSTIETWEHKRLPDYQGTMVTLSFFRLGKKYRVTRCKAYQGTIEGAKGANRLVVEKDGQPLWVNLKDKRDIQKALTELLGFSYNLFINSIISPQKVVRFIESSGPVRKAILEESFKMLWINAAAKLAREKQAVIKSQLLVVTLEHVGIQKNITSLNEMIATMDKAAQEFEVDKTKQISTLTKDMGILEEESKAQRKGVKPILDRESLLLRDKAQYETDPLYLDRNKLTLELGLKLPERNRLKKNLRDTQLNINKAKKPDADCPTCHQPMPIRDTKDYLVSLRKTRTLMQTDLETLNKRVRELEEKVIAANKVAALLTDTHSDLRDLQTSLIEARETNLKIEGSKGRLEEMAKQLSHATSLTFKDLSAPVKRKVYENTISRNKLTTKITKLTRQVGLYDWAINTPLGPNGIKAFMFNKLVDLINFQLRTLENYTGLGVTLSVEGSGVRKNIEAVVTREDYPVSYADLSGGEGNLVNVMIALSIGAIVTIEQPVNIRVFDEVFEGLDSANVEVVATMLSQINPDISTFVITHQASFNPQNCKRIILSNGE
jgi:DNA repair exonuclease SbcCD ATPase subunit